MEKQEAYSTLSKESFSVGDEVKILRTAENGEWGWPGKWDDTMNAAVGVVGVVTGIGDDGVTVRGKGDASKVVLNFPFFVLEKQIPEFHTIKLGTLSYTIPHSLFLEIQKRVDQEKQ